MRTEPKSVPSIKSKLIHLNNELDLLYKNYHEWYSFDRLTPFELYVLLLEDRRYFQHSGLDIRSIAREFIRMITLQRYGGASTIEMQFVRTVNNRKELTLRRKIREMVIAFLINFHFNKMAVLRSYLNIAFFGSGLIGCEAASNQLFGRGTSDLTDAEAATLAAMLVAPRPLTPSPQWSQRVERRAQYALRLAPLLEKRFQEVPIRQL